MTNVVDISQNKSQLLRRKIMQLIKKFGVLFLLFFMFLGALFYPASDAPGPVLDAQIPSVIIDNQGKKITRIEGNESGHFTFIGDINDVPVKFFYDTGATDVAIPQPIAKYLQLKQGARKTFSTANGTSFGFDTSLDKITIGHIEIRDVDATITTAMEGDEILLGMSFLKQLDIRHSDGKLLLAIPD